MGLRIDQAKNGNEALELIEAADIIDPYKLVLMDWKMPGMDGVETLRKLEEKQSLMNIPSRAKRMEWTS